LNAINRTKDSQFTAEQFIADCRSRSGSEEIYQQSYLCNPQGAATNHIVEWSAIERCRYDYQIIRVHFENNQIVEQFGEFSPGSALFTPAAPKIGISSKPLFSNSSANSATCKPLATRPALAARSAGKPVSTAAADFPPSISPAKNMTSAFPL